jgi:hypothetical protein
MANAMYPLSRQAWADGDLDWSGQDWRVILLDNTYAYSEAHDFLTDVNAAQVAVSGNLTGKTNVLGVCDADDVVFPAVLVGDIVSSIVVYQWTGVAATSRVAIFYDTLATAELISFSTDNGDIIVRWSNGPTKMFRL